VDLLPDREADTLAGWLREHPGVRVVCRDRAGAYAEGAATGAPEAAQVADRWHLWHNLAEHTEKTVARHRGCWAQPADAPAGDRPPAEPDARPELGQLAEKAALDRREASALVTRTRERYAAVQALREQGKGIKTIMRELGLAKETVRRFARASCVEDLLATARDGRPSIVDEFKPYLHHRFNLGHTNASALFSEIQAQGYRGSLGTVLGYLRPFRALGAAPAAVPPPPTVRAVTGAILRHPDRRDADDQARLKDVRAACPHLDTLAEHVTEFAEMLVGRHGERLDNWIASVEADDQPDLHRFVNGLRRDETAVRNGLTLSHSSGAVEGSVNRIKMIKRQMYGRAGFDLLRKRVLLAH
jgi:transposase